DAAEAINALLERVRLDELVDVVVARLGDVAVDLDLPGPRVELLGVVLRTVTCARGELVEVVVARNVLVQARSLGGTQRALLDVGDFGEAPALRCGVIAPQGR